MATYQERYDNIVQKNEESIKNLNQLIKIKEIEVLKDMKKYRATNLSDRKEEKEKEKPKKLGPNLLPYQSKL